MSLLSLRKSVTDLDHLEEQRNQFEAQRIKIEAQRAQLQQTLTRCVQATCQYAIELNPHDAIIFRENVDRIASVAAAEMTQTQCAQVASDFRGELREYHGKTQREADRLRSEMDSMVESMQGLIANVATSGSDHERVLHQEFNALEATAQKGDLTRLKVAIHHAAETAIKSCGEIRRSCDVVIAQLQDEIRNLHREVDHQRRAAMTDQATNIWNRAKLDNRVKDLVLLNEPFSVILIGVPDLVHVTRRDPRLIPGLLQAIAGRLQSMAKKGGEAGMAGRWSDEAFALIFNLPLSAIPMKIVDMEKTLSSAYTVQIDGASIEVSIKAHITTVERPKDSNESAFYLQLGQAAFEAVTH
jgi:GGDEF domain-containing protein